MSDIYSAQQRSAVMSRIRSTDTQPERTVRRALHSFGFRFNVLASFDANPFAVETFKANVSSRCLHEKAEQLTGKRLSEEGCFVGKLDLFAGEAALSRILRTKPGR